MKLKLVYQNMHFKMHENLSLKVEKRICNQYNEQNSIQNS